MQQEFNTFLSFSLILRISPINTLFQNIIIYLLNFKSETSAEFGVKAFALLFGFSRILISFTLRKEITSDTLSLLLTHTFTEDIYLLRGLQIEEYNIEQDYDDDDNDEDNNIHANLIENNNHNNLQNQGDNFYYKAHILLKVQIMGAYFIYPTKLICLAWEIEEQNSSELVQQTIQLFIMVSLAIDLHFIQTELLIQIKEIIKMDIPSIQQIFLKENLLTVLQFVTSVFMIKEIYNNRVLFVIYLYFTFLLGALYLWQMWRKPLALQLFLPIQFIFHITFEYRVINTNLQSMSQFAQNKSIKFSIIQRFVLLSSYVYYLQSLPAVSSIQSVVLWLAFFSVFVSTVRYVYHTRYNTPEQIEIYDPQDLQEYTQLWEIEIKLNKLDFYKNLKVVKIYLHYQYFPIKLQLLKCFLSAFGKAEIISYHSTRLKIFDSDYYQELMLNNQVCMQEIERVITDDQPATTVSRQIKILRIRLNPSDKFLDMIKLFLKFNIQVQIESLYSTLESPIIDSNNQYVDQMQIQLMQSLVFKELVSHELTFNPIIILYDLYD